MRDESTLSLSPAQLSVPFPPLASAHTHHVDTHVYPFTHAKNRKSKNNNNNNNNNKKDNKQAIQIGKREKKKTHS